MLWGLRLKSFNPAQVAFWRRPSASCAQQQMHMRTKTTTKKQPHGCWMCLSKGNSPGPPLVPWCFFCRVGVPKTKRKRPEKKKRKKRRKKEEKKTKKKKQKKKKKKTAPWMPRAEPPEATKGPLRFTDMGEKRSSVLDMWLGANPF